MSQRFPWNIIILLGSGFALAEACKCYSELFGVGVWSYARWLRDAQLKSLTSAMIKLQFSSKSSVTVSKYASGWKTWRSWAMSKIDDPVIPARPLHVALLLTELCTLAMEKGTGVSVLDGAAYSIRWAHQMTALIPPTDHPVVKSCLEGAKRKLARPVRPK